MEYQKQNSLKELISDLKYGLGALFIIWILSAVFSFVYINYLPHPYIILNTDISIPGYIFFFLFIVCRVVTCFTF